jgi:8-oxo-dGTP pyrophosphatase MutT (NUDIX family)
MLVRDRSTGHGRNPGATGSGIGSDSCRGAGSGIAPEFGEGTESGVEVFVFRRVASLQFAAGMLVFPGGGVDERDVDERDVDERDVDQRIRWYGPPPQTFAPSLSADPALARALVVAAIRETFEECGVLLAGPPGGDVVTLTERDWAEGWQERHARLLSGDLGLAELLAAAGLELRADLVRPWAHWITPPVEGSRRYDTRFFLAAMPSGQIARDLGGEGEQARWLRAADGVQQYVAGQVRMLPPTAVCLEELAAAPSVAALLATLRRIRPVMPWTVRRPDGILAVEVDLDGRGGGEPRA